MPILKIKETNLRTNTCACGAILVMEAWHFPHQGDTCYLAHCICGVLFVASPEHEVFKRKMHIRKEGTKC